MLGCLLPIGFTTRQTHRCIAQWPLSWALCPRMRRDPWVLPIEAEARRKAQSAKRQLNEAAGGASDHLALVRACLALMQCPAGVTYKHKASDACVQCGVLVPHPACGVGFAVLRANFLLAWLYHRSADRCAVMSRNICAGSGNSIRAGYLHLVSSSGRYSDQRPKQQPRRCW